MDHRLVTDIKKMYYSARQRNCFQPIFERKLAHYIQQHAPEGSVHWHKLRYEFRSTYRKCRDEQKSATVYLNTMTKLTEAALAGTHKHVELKITSLSIVTVSDSA